MIISPGEIDKTLETPGTNLNWLESIKFAMIINYLKPEIAIVDCPSNNIIAYSEHLKTYLKENIQLRCEHKADSKYVMVGAASILAKVTRDREIAKLKEIYGDFNSGYPSDLQTIEFLKENWNKYTLNTPLRSISPESILHRF